MKFPFSMKFDFKRKYIITLEVEASSGREARETIEGLGLKVQDCKLQDNTITGKQFRALHKWCSLLAEEMVEMGIDMKTILKEGFDFPPTTWSIKEFVWKKAQLSMFGKKSTKELDKMEEINKIVDVINRTLIERTNGNLKAPQWPNEETR